MAIASVIAASIRNQKHEPELNKSYHALIQCLSNYQVEVEASYSTSSLKSNALFYVFVFFGLSLIICIPISVFYPLMLLPVIVVLALLGSFVNLANSNNGYHGKHPTNEIELNLHFRSVMHTLGRYKSNSDNNFQPLSENTSPHAKQPGHPINTSRLNCNASLFKLANPYTEQNLTKRDLSYTA